MKRIVRNCGLLLLLWAVTGRSQSSPQSHASQPAESFADPGFQPKAGAALDPKEFRYSRSIPDSPEGLTALLLDAGVLAHSRPDLADLRIADSDNHQIPYLLERRQDTLNLELALVPENSPASEKRSYYRLELPFENLPAVKLVLTTSERTFQRQVSVEMKRAVPDPRSETSMETVASAIWRHDHPEASAPPLALDLPSSLGTTSVAVTVDEGDNHPLALGPVHLELPLYRLRFFYPANAKLTLLYGHDALSAPRYDLELMAPRLAGVSSRELSLDPEKPAQAVPDNAAIQARIFWGVLIAAVLVVSALLVRLLRSEKAAEPRNS